ncbi:TolC family protein [Ralstonia sp. 21MJYT02-11]|uniref:TolC family protein n=1 Tax=Ralstonia soli TaxID=2953896 RepID=A0ABT1AS02_9RALS|nr:TolC family protein [Ralstonia soli]
MSGVDNDPAVRAEYADLDAALGDRKQRESEAGWRVVSSAGIGKYRELVTDQIITDYYGRNMAVGVAYPLFGSLKRQLDALRGSEFAVQRQQIRITLRRAERRLVLRTTYADWWRAQQEGLLCGPLRTDASQAMDQLGRRERAGWLRGSEASELRGQWQALLKSCRVQAQIEAETRATIERLTQKTVPDGTTAVGEPLAAKPEALAAWQGLLDRQPRVVDQETRLREADGNRQQHWYDSIESSASVGYNLNNRAGVASTGNSVVASINFSMPFDVAGATAGRRDAGDARYIAAKARLDAERQEVATELGRALRTHRDAALELQLREDQLAAAQLQLHEQRKRTSLDGDQAIVRVQAAQRQYYQAAFARVAAWHQLWVQESALRTFVDVDQDPSADSVLGEPRLRWQGDGLNAAAATESAGAGQVSASASGTDKTWRQGVYLWDSQALLDPARMADELRTLRQARIDQLYVGLNRAQVTRMADTREGLRTLMDAAGKQGMRVSLLLGDPAWLHPGERKSLLGLIGQLKDLPFASLHLDLEVEQLGWPVPDGRLHDWLDTLAAAARTSPWPVEISSHPRWFGAQEAGRPCVPCRLPDIGVTHVSLMIYTRNPQKSAVLADDIARRWPKLVFRLAQSVETKLPADETWAGASPRQLEEQVEGWRTRLAPQGVTGVDWQDWHDYSRLFRGGRSQ